MELFLASILLGFVFLILLSLQLLLLLHHRGSTDLPPGTTGWPFIGETLEFLSTGWKGHPERFVFDRMSRFSEHCFKTSLLGEREVAVMCGAQGNKFLFSNENKLVEAWWPAAVNKVFPSSNQTSDAKYEARNMRRLLPLFLKPEALQRYVGVMDCIARRHFDESWEGKDEILVFPLAKRYTFWLACKIFLSLEDPNHIARFADPFNHIASGIITLPVDLPGTPFNRAIKSAKFIRKELKEVIMQRTLDLAANKATPTQDIMSHMLTTPIDVKAGQERFMNEDDIADKILGLLIGGHDTASAAITFIVKYLAELPHVYDQVYKEQMEIACSKREGELLTWDDLKKMKYSWNVASEVMRLAPPLQGAFREALHDFTFSGFRVPKGWKLYWSANSTHRNAKYFPDPESFDPSRFEGSGPAPYTYVPFGGGPRMCPGKEYARLEILVFMHHVVRRFKWEKMIADEKIIVNPLPIPAKGLPIRIHPHQA
ncbi:hypothetical protein V2J09_000127 [Rumex salicifolius]